MPYRLLNPIKRKSVTPKSLKFRYRFTHKVQVSSVSSPPSGMLHNTKALSNDTVMRDNDADGNLGTLRLGGSDLALSMGIP